MSRLGQLSPREKRLPPFLLRSNFDVSSTFGLGRYARSRALRAFISGAFQAITRYLPPVKLLLSVIIESFKPEKNTLVFTLKIIEYITVSIFSVEYLLRIFTADFKFPSNKKGVAIIKYIFPPMALIDLFAILPFFIPMIIPMDLRFLRILRMIRVLRLFKVSRYNDSFSLIKKVLIAKKYELITTVFTTFILLLLASSLMYYVETKAQPEAFPNILASMWWGMATLTTVGYGDVFPITVLGKLLSSIIALLGIGIVALPTGIISSGFIEVIKNPNDVNKDTYEYCPHCGKKLK